MSRNLLSIDCVDCEPGGRGPGYFDIENLIGKPLEFRQYGDEAPVPGVPWTCTRCKTKYFVIIEHYYDSYTDSYQTRFDLSYYESFNDEHNDDKESIAHWCDGSGLIINDDGHVRPLNYIDRESARATADKLMDKYDNAMKRLND